MAKKKKHKVLTTQNLDTLIANENIEDFEVQDEMEESMLSYAVMTIVDRALPDVRDGLKPVHRRILWTCAEKGYDYNKPFIKNAKISGDVMGNYHPHSSCYGTITNLAQDWKMRYPMMDFQGNKGSLDGDEPAADRYCVTGDTLINTDKGLVKIANITDTELNSDNAIDIKVDSFEGNVNTAHTLFNSGEQDIIELTTKAGFHIKGTPNHPLMTVSTNTAGQPQYEWKTLEQLTTNDYLVVNAQENQLSSTIELEEWRAKFLGCLFGTNADIKYGGSGITYNGISTFNDDAKQVTIEGYQHYFDEANVDRDYINIVSKTLDNGVTTQVVYNFQLQIYETFLIQEKFAITSEKTKQLPNIILQASKANQKDFLKYFYDTRNAITDNGIVCNVGNVVLARQLQIMLLHFGIFSFIENNKDEYTITISEPRDIQTFYNNIGVVTQENSIKIKSLLNKQDNTVYDDYIPFIVNYIDNKYPGNSEWLEEHKIDRYNIYVNNQQQANELLSSEDEQLLQEWFNSGYRYQKIATIEKLANKEVVYSVKVDSDCHSFTANGFINHNTEARLHKNTLAMLEDVKDKQCVDFQPNYSETLEEPTILPALLPNFLVNPTEGIAVGYTSKTPGHNLNEVCDAIIYAIKHDDYTLDNLLKYIKGPDMPTGGILLSKGIRDLYETGQQKLTFRAPYVIENNIENNNPQIVFTSVTPDMDKPKTLETIDELINTKVLPRVLEVRDESQGMDVRVVVECQPTANIPMIVSTLYEKTNLQKNVSFFMRGVVGSTLKLVTLIDYVDIYLTHRKEVLTRRFNYQLNVLNKKLNIQQGLAKVMRDIKKAINKIIDSETLDDARNVLKKDYELNDEQVAYILDKKINSLSHMDRDKIFNNITDLENEIKQYEELLNNSDKFKDYMVEQLENLKKTSGDERRTIIVDDFENSNTDTIVMPDDVVLTLSSNNAILFYEEEEFGALESKLLYRDRQNYFKQVLHCKRDDEVVVVFADGEIARYSVSDLQYNNTKLQKAICIFVYNLESDKTLVAMCKDGMVKKTPISKIKFKRGKKTYLMTLDNEIVFCHIIQDTSEDVMNVITNLGRVARFSCNSFNSTAVGARALATTKLDDGEYIIGGQITQKALDDKLQMLFVFRLTNGDLWYKVMNANDMIIKGRHAGPLPCMGTKKFKEMCYFGLEVDGFNILDFKNKKITFKNFVVTGRNSKGAEFLYTTGNNYQNLDIES